MLAYLILRGGEPVLRTSLASVFWPDDDETVARGKLRRHAYHILQALPAQDETPWLLVSHKSIAWNANAPAIVDVTEFDRLVNNPMTIEAAAELYRGELLEGFHELWLLPEQERLRTAATAALLDLAIGARSRREFTKSYEYAMRVLAIDEWREDALRQMMTASYESGDRTTALGVYDGFAKRLHAEMKLDPMPETIALRDAIVANTEIAQTEEHHEKTASGEATTSRSLIGRSDELAALRAHWLRAARGSGTTIFLSGEAGIGKSHLTREVQVIVESQGGRAIRGRTSQPEAVPYQPIVEALRHAAPFMKVEASDEAWLAVLAPFVPEVRRLATSLPNPVDLEPERANLRLRAAFTRAFEACARVRPIAIILEDLHHAQTDTIEAIAAVASSVRGASILLLITYRSTEASTDSAIRSLRRQLVRASTASHLALGHLPSIDIEALVNSAGLNDERFAREVCTLSEGNPLFAWQLIYERIERGRPGTKRARTARTVSEVIQGRLESMPADTRAVAEVAATIGETFTIEEIAEVGGWNEPNAQTALNDLLDRQLVNERAGESFEYGFTHSLIRSAIYDGSIGDTRRVRHQRAASVLAVTRTERDGSLPLIAHHWLRAGEPERARAALIRASQVALASYARRDAYATAVQGLALDPTLEERFELLDVVIAATDKLADPTLTEKTLEEFESVAGSIGRPAQFKAHVARITFHDHHAQHITQTYRADRLAEFVAKDDPYSWRVEALLQIANARLQCGIASEAQIILESIDIAAISEPRQIHQYHTRMIISLVRLGDFDAVKTTLASFRAYLDANPSLDGEWSYAFAEHRLRDRTGTPSEILQSAKLMMDIAEQRGDITNQATGLMCMASAEYQLHDIVAARRDYQAAMELWAQAQHWHGWMAVANNLGLVEAAVGHFGRAASLWTMWRLHDHESRSPVSQAVAESNLAHQEISLGDPHAALTRLERLQAILDDTGETKHIGELLIARGRAMCACGNERDGLPLMRAGIDAIRPLTQSTWLARRLADYVSAMLSANHTEDLERAASELQTIFDNDPDDQFSPAEICLALAAASRFMDDHERATALLDKGRIAVTERFKALVDLEDRTAFAAIPANVAILEGRTIST